MSAPVLAGDSETTLIRPWEWIPRLVCISFSKADEYGLVHAIDKTAERVAAGIIEEENAFANGPFDWAVWMKRWPEVTPRVFAALEEGRAHDVLTREKLLDIANGRYKFIRGKGEGKGHSLQSCVKRSLKIDLAKKDTWREHYEELIDKPVNAWPVEAYEYAIGDPVVTAALYDSQEDRRDTFKRVHEVDVFADECRQVRAKWWLHLTSARGIKVDQEQVEKFEKQVNEKYERFGIELVKTGLVERKGDVYVKKVAPAREYMEKLCAQAGIEPELTRKEQVKLSRDFVASVAALTSDHLLEKYVEFNSLQKLKGTYIKPMKAAGHLAIHPQFEELVDTGRTSCYRPNLQNLPRRFLVPDPNNPDKLINAPGVRECYVPRKGYVFVLCDFDKAELLSFAEVQVLLFGRSALGDALIAGIDPHTRVMAQMRGISYEEAVRLIAAKDPEAVNGRNCAKPANFGFPGGLGAERFVGYAKASYNVIVTLEQAQALRDDWRRTWPEVNDYLEYVGGLVRCRACGGSGEVDVDGEIAVCHRCRAHCPSCRGTGQRKGEECRRCDGDGIIGRGSTTTSVVAVGSGRCRGNVSFTEVANGFFQMLTAEGAKHAGWCVAKRQYLEPNSALYRTHTVNFVHDELMLEVPIPRAKAAAVELEEVMVAAYREWVPHVAQAVKATARIETRWTKG